MYKMVECQRNLREEKVIAKYLRISPETPRRGLSINGRSYSDQILQEFFPSNFPNINIASHVAQNNNNNNTNNNNNNNNNNMYNNNNSNNNLSEASEHSPMQQRSPSTPVKKTPPPVAHRSSIGATPPKPKPKPKPVRTNSVSMTTNGTTNGYYSSRSSTESLNDPVPLNSLGNGALNSSGEIQGDQEEIVHSSKSRNFFKEQERKASLSSQEGLDRKPSLTSLSSFDGSPTNTIRRNGSLVKTPGVKSKPIISIPENGTNGYSSNGSSPKPPPPAPPKRSDSIKHNGSYVNGNYNGSVNGLNGHSSSSDEAPSLPLKCNSTSQLSDDGCPSPPYPTPPEGFTSPINDTTTTTTSYSNGIKIVPPPPVEVNGNGFDTSLKKRNSIDDAFGSTDDLLNDLMADIDDFSAQLDAMF